MPRLAASKRDEVDHIVDTLLADPGRAEDVKLMLRRRLKAEPVVHLRAVPAASSAAQDSLDDMWDNVPV